MADKINWKQVGIPISELGEKLRLLAENLKPLGMYVMAETDALICFDNSKKGNLDTVTSITLNVTFLT